MPPLPRTASPSPRVSPMRAARRLQTPRARTAARATTHWSTAAKARSASRTSAPRRTRPAYRSPCPGRAWVFRPRPLSPIRAARRHRPRRAWTAARATVSAPLNGAITGGWPEGGALADGRSTAEVTAIGMDGGAGRDVLVNAGAINVQGAESNAHAVGVSVAANVSMAGLAGGAALADTSTTARTVAKGMDGGAGDDKIYNTGTIDVQGKSKADAVSVSVSISAALGVAVGAEVSKSNTTSETTVIGIDAGGGRDEIGNAGAISVKAEAESKAATVSVGLSLGAGGDATVAEAKASATATAVRINQIDDTPGSGTPDGTNVIENTGAVTAIATSKSTGTSISGNLRGFTAGGTTNTLTPDG